MFSKLATDQLLVYWLDHWIKSRYFSEVERSSSYKGKISAQINPWLIVDFSSDIPCTIISWKVPDIICVLVSCTILVRLVGYSLLKIAKLQTEQLPGTCSQLIIFLVSDPRQSNSLFPLSSIIAIRSSAFRLG